MITFSLHIKPTNGWEIIPVHVCTVKQQLFCVLRRINNKYAYTPVEIKALSFLTTVNQVKFMFSQSIVVQTPLIIEKHIKRLHQSCLDG